MACTDTAPVPHEIVWSVATSLVPARALQLVADLGIADYVTDEPVAAKELAPACSVDADALDRVLKLLVSLGVFGRERDGYRHTEASGLLRDDHPMSMRPFARMMGLPIVWSSFAGLDTSLRTGAPAVEGVEPEGFWAYLRTRPEEGRIFDEAMAAKARAEIGTILSAYDFRPFRTIADIGGGRGHLLEAVLDVMSGAHGVLFDLPGVIDTLHLRSPRLTLQAGDFFEDPLPRSDAYILMEVLHDWDDEKSASILRAIRQAARPGAVVLVIEVLSEESGDPRVHTLDLIMLAVTGGRQRTAADLTRLLHGSGFRVTAVLGTPGPLRIVEAVAV